MTDTGRANEEEYRKICAQVLERDGWRCQYCGSLRNLQVHHQRFRSHGGPDTADNLITLCSACHSRIHAY